MLDAAPTIEGLPHYMTVDDNHYFLNINRDISGQWSAAYLHYGEDGEQAIPQLWINHADDLAEVALRLDAKLKRYNRVS